MERSAAIPTFRERGGGEEKNIYIVFEGFLKQ